MGLSKESVIISVQILSKLEELVADRGAPTATLLGFGSELEVGRIDTAKLLKSLHGINSLST